MASQEGENEKEAEWSSIDVAIDGEYSIQMIGTKNLMKKREKEMGFVSHRVKRSNLEAGDHIYTWRTAFTYSHHGIYVGGDTVVHFTQDQNLSSSGHFTSTHFSSSVSNVPAACLNFPDCGFRKHRSGVTISCLNCFMGNGSLYRFEYGVSPLAFIAKFRGGTCTTAKSDPSEAVIHRAIYLLHNGFGNYNLFANNCEDFALYCKTGLLVCGQEAVGCSGQAWSALGVPMAAIFSWPLRIFVSSPIVIGTVAVNYALNRYARDIGVRSDVTKVKVEDMALFRRDQCGDKDAKDTDAPTQTIPAENNPVAEKSSDPTQQLNEPQPPTFKEVSRKKAS